MTIFYPDISGYDEGINLDGMAAVVVKATEGTTYVNPDFARVAKDATRRGIPWAAYHFLWPGAGEAQADFYHSVAGSVPCMLDIETTATGARPKVSDALAFATRLKALGGRTRLAYLPRWYWEAIGKPDLTLLADAGMALVSSNYPADGYSDGGPGWLGYGGMVPLVWQYTSTFPLNGFKVDMNAFRGTVDQFRALIYGSTPGGGDMLQTDKVTGNLARGNTVGDVLADQSNFRDEWYAVPPAHSKNPPGAGTRFDLLMQAVALVPQINTEVKAVGDAIDALTPGNVDAAALGAALAANAAFVDAVATAAANKVLAGLRDIMKAAVA